MPLAFDFCTLGCLEAALRAYCGKALAFLPSADASWIQCCQKYGAATVLPAGTDPCSAWESLADAGVKEADRFLLLEEAFLTLPAASLTQCKARLDALGVPAESLLATVPAHVEQGVLQTLLDWGVKLFLLDAPSPAANDILNAGRS